MKTAREVYKETHSRLIDDCQSSMSIALEAMEAYAIQAIEECAEVAEVDGIGIANHVVDKESILRVILQLK